MSDALPLPPRPNLEQYKKLAKDLQRACKSDGPDAIRQWATRWAETLARLQGREQDTQREAERLARQWAQMQKSQKDAARCTLTRAQFFLARAHGFTCWPKFATHLEGLSQANSTAFHFEQAADAIVTGDIATLRTLIRTNPKLVAARSEREHRSTLLHYVSANGIEDFRQKTPHNIIEITKLLLDAGADVNAESDAYGGRSTILGLTATSCHPEAAGVQLPLMELLIGQGATLERADGGSAVVDCLRNGRKAASELLANRGGRLDLEAAAGVGRLDIVKSFFSEEGRLIRRATPEQMKDGFAWACEFGRTTVVDFLLQRGIALDLKLPHNGQTGLHWAAYGGHAETVRLLLERGAPVHAKDESFQGTPLEWALYQWGSSPYWAERGSYYETVALLARAGATLATEWLEQDDAERRHALRKLRADLRMQAALRGELSP